ncbi:MAG TPA: TolC family protein [Verrucomicrobiae bacterium]
MKLLRGGGCFVAVLLVIFLAGCSRNYFRKSADKQVYGIIQAKSPLVQNADPRFTIEQTNQPPLEAFPVRTNVQDFLGPDGEQEQGARVLTLRDALEVAIKASRSYQASKEQLYISALSLALARHQFAPIFSSRNSVEYQVQTERAVTLTVDETTGEAKPVFSDNLVEHHQIGGSVGIDTSWLIRDIGRLTTAFTLDATRFLIGSGNPITSSQLAATFTRPLLQNANYKQETERLVQGERQVLYDLREFTRYRKNFTVQIATAYYGVLGNRDTVRNSFLNLQSSRKNAERSRALAQEGRITQSDLGRLEQQVLTTESTWIGAVRTYKQALDIFKIQLGLDADANIVLDDHELESLQIRHPNISAEDSIQVALVARLDLLNVKDQFEDAERQIKLAESFLKPQVDFTAGVGLNSDPAKGNWALPDPARYHWNAGLFLDPGLDRVAERNSYRTSLITRNRAARAVVQQEDDIKLQVRDSWRTLDQAKRNYEISEVGVKLAERRVEEQNLLAELGRAKAQDQVDAQNDLITSKNLLTQALVTHTIARLQFWNNLGILYVKDNGQWEEVKDAKTQ